MQDVPALSSGWKASGPGRRSGMALLITLLAMALMTIIVVAFLGTMIWEQAASRRDYDNQRARAMATLGMNTAVAQLRTALGVWDNPFVNFTNSATASNYYYWSASPGILTRWAYTNVAPLTNYPLFSIDPNGATNLVNLNAEEADGTYPIIGGPTPPGLSVYWANVLANPGQAAGSANPIVGRYAFWVDDENAKININTADGTLKYTANSLGLGTPSEVSLQVLQDLSGGSPANLSTSEATNIVYLARTTGFNSVREILRTSGSTPYLYTNNVFDLTSWGRSPELNIWGEPKINLISVSIPWPPASPPVHGVLETNNITGQALTEIYPTPSQLPPFKTYNPPGSASFNATNYWRPLVMSAYFPTDPSHGIQADGENWMMFHIATYLGGSNSVNEPIIWPIFPAASGTNFTGKYSLRQLDALATSITDDVGKGLAPETYNEVGVPGNSPPPGNVFPYSAPSTPPGLLSHEEALGVGRSAKINEIYISATPYGSVTGPPYSAPYLRMAIYLETYLPAGFAGVDLLNVKSATGLPPAGTEVGNYAFGASVGGSGNDINILDIPTNTAPTTNSAGVAVIYAPSNASLYRSINTGDIIPPGTTNNYWQDTILRNDQGIDFLGNPEFATNGVPLADPDQLRAAAYHSYLTNNTLYTSSGLYPGSGSGLGKISTVLQLGNPSASGTAGTNVWYPGQYRTVSNGYASANYYMTNADLGTTLHITGGLIVTGGCNGFRDDPDPTPFEAGVQGSTSPVARAGNQDSYDGAEFNTGLFWSVNIPTPANKNQTTDTGSGVNEISRDRIVNGSIPVTMTLTVPAGSALSPQAGTTVTYDIAVADPLVNKFPGDWIPTTNATASMGNGVNPPATMNPTGYGGYAVYYNGQNPLATGPTANSAYYDPDSFWMPTLDPKIPRSARFPNIGYLNYLRTGVFPDDETVPIGQQHGTPYRCLNFNAASDPSQTLSVVATAKTGYPDWAILDLFTVPSTLIPYNGPYGFYKYPNGTNTGVAAWTAGSIMNGNPTNMYYYGTWGGSTPGRINPNGAVIYTTNVNIPTPGITRLLPLEALMTNILVNQTIPNGSGTTPPSQLTNAPTFTGGTAVNASSIASAITTYLSTNTYGAGGNPAPLREPAELCNIPSIAALYPNDSAHYNPTRNDLIRQIIGNLTTQSNVFSVWVEGQTITKSKLNSNYGIYESGDQITGSVRYHFVVERYLQPGAGGVYGNTQDPTPHGSTGYPSVNAQNNSFTNALGDIDGMVGTYDDPADPAYHPVNPRYLYRIVYAEEIRD